MFKKIFAAAFILFTAMGFFVGCKNAERINIQVWNYYNNDQKAAFEAVVAEFNATYGLEHNINVEAKSKESVELLQSALIESSNKETGAEAMPTMFQTYADTAFALDKPALTPLADLKKYFTKDELDLYVDCFIEEGMINGELKIFPWAKATEVLLLNKTDWDKFETEYNEGKSEADKVSVDDFNTVESMTTLSEKYFNFTKSKTIGADIDGKALVARDAMANFVFSSFEQLGKHFFTVDSANKVTYDFDKPSFKIVWNYSFVPYVKGYYSLLGKFATGDIESGRALAAISSTSGVTYFPSQIKIDTTNTYNIEMLALPVPTLNGSNIKIQQGAGWSVVKSDEKTERACAEFLKWLTAAERNIQFCAGSGYLPVLKSACDIELIESLLPSDIKNRQKILDVLKVGIKQVNQDAMFTPKPYDGGVKARNKVDTLKTGYDDQKNKIGVAQVCVEELIKIKNAISALEDKLNKGESGVTQADIDLKVKEYNNKKAYFLSDEYFEIEYAKFIADDVFKTT